MSDLSLYPNFNKFLHKNILAIDYGTKNLGLATFTPGRDPFPLTAGVILNIKHTDHKLNKEENDFNYLIQQLILFIKNESIDVIVVGIPTHISGNKDGKISKTGEIISKFAILLEQMCQLKVYLQDEALTSYEAESRMKNSPEYNFKINLDKIDEVSAQIILEDFIKKNLS